MALTPETIGKYRIVRELAKGGMGTVYVAEHPSLKKEVILKKLTLRSSNSTIRERFKREAQILIDLSSPYIVRMFDYFTEGRSDYIVLEFVDGMALDNLIKKQGALSPQLALFIFLEACYGLKVAHNKGIVHRDIKPANILISQQGHVKLADFGIASGEKEEASPQPSSAQNANVTVVANDNITRVGSTLGTPAYMSPEQLKDSSSVDQRADIYSMGVMLYEMVTGTKPYPGDMTRTTIENISRGKYTPPKKINKDLPPIVCRLIKKMMRPNPSQRYETIDPVIRQIKAYLKKYDNHKIRVDLARAIYYKKPIELPAYETKHHRAQKIGCIAAAALVLLAGGIAAWNLGLFHATILRRWFTPVTLTMEIPAAAKINSDLPARAFFFENDNDSIPDVKNGKRQFIAQKKASGEQKTQVVKTKPVYVHPGDYRIKIATGSYVWWKSVTVGREKMNIELTFLKDETRRLVINARAEDYETQKDISASTNFYVELADKRVNLKSIQPSLLTTGKVYKIYAVADGYEEEYFSLLIDWYQDTLFVNASLKKK